MLFMSKYSDHELVVDLEKVEEARRKKCADLIKFKLGRFITDNEDEIKLIMLTPAFSKGEVWEHKTLTFKNEKPVQVPAPKFIKPKGFKLDTPKNKELFSYLTKPLDENASLQDTAKIASKNNELINLFSISYIDKILAEDVNKDNLIKMRKRVDISRAQLELFVEDLIP